MRLTKVSPLVFALVSTTTLARAQAQEPFGEPMGQPVGPEITQVDGTPPPAGPTQENPIPPNAEGRAIPAQNGGYCFGGPHPAPGGGWEATTTPHVHDYAPFDLRLFSFRQGCYYFIGDPRDFGYTGQTYDYYGAHPVADAYGGGWCFMIGPHYHWWRPWSSNFTVVGPWNYWDGPYDPFFWAYWPYYSFFYRSYYPGFYAGGRFFHTWRTAPAIARVPPTGWRGGPGAAGGAWRGGAIGARGSALRAGGGYGAYGGGGAWRGVPAGGGGWRGSPVPGGAPAYRAAPIGGWHAPPGGAWRGSSGGGFRGGGGFHGGGHGGGHR